MRNVDATKQLLMHWTSNRNLLYSIAIALAGILIINWLAIYNGYPLVYSDTGTYLYSSVKLEAPVDRPLGYGIFIRMCTLTVTTWPVIFMQALIVYVLIYRTLKLYFQQIRLLQLIVLIVLAAISSLPWYAAQLMPDIFAGILALSVFLFFYDAVSWKGRLAYGLLIGFFAMSHFSFIPFVFLLTVFLVLLRVRRIFTTERRFLYRGLLIGCCLMGSVLCCMWSNYNTFGKFRMSMSGNVYLTAKLCDKSILYTYLQDNCGKKNMPLCAFKDSIATSPMRFLWNPNQPFQRGGAQWLKANEEYAPIVHDILTTPKYRALFIREIGRATLSQLEQNNYGSGLMAYGGPEYAPGNVIYPEFNKDYARYRSCVQNTSTLDNPWINNYVPGILQVSMLFILAALCYRPSRKALWPLLATCLAAVLFNAFITGAFANVYDRLQARITWLLIFGALVAVAWVVRHVAGIRKEKRKLFRLPFSRSA